MLRTKNFRGIIFVDIKSEPQKQDSTVWFVLLAQSLCYTFPVQCYFQVGLSFENVCAWMGRRDCECHGDITSIIWTFYALSNNITRSKLLLAATFHDLIMLRLFAGQNIHGTTWMLLTVFGHKSPLNLSEFPELCRKTSALCWTRRQRQRCSCRVCDLLPWLNCRQSHAYNWGAVLYGATGWVVNTVLANMQCNTFVFPLWTKYMFFCLIILSKTTG